MPIISLRRWNMLFALALLGGVAVVLGSRTVPQSVAGVSAPVEVAAAPAPLTNHPAPDFTLTSLDGESIALSDLRGQVVLVNMWATWCPPCRAEMPAMQAVYRTYADEGFTILAVNAREEAATVAAFMHDYRLEFPALLDQQGTVAAQYGVTLYPSSFFIDRRGIIRAVYHGPLSHAVLEGTVTQLLREEG